MNESRGNGRHSMEDHNRRMHEQQMQDRRFRDDDDRSRWGEDRDRGMGDQGMERGDRQSQGYRGDSRDHREERYGQSDRGFGQGQSGYMAGRYGEDRSISNMGRNQGFGDHDQDRGYPQRMTFQHRGGDETSGGWYGGGGMGGGRMGGGQGMGPDDRWTGRGGQDYWRGNDPRFGQPGGGQQSGSGQYGGHYGGGQYGQQNDQFGGQRGMQGGQGGGYGQYGGRDPFGGGYGGEQYGSRSGGQQQSFRGKGPKNFTRSDERMREQISEALSDDHDIDASEIEVEVKNGEVTLKGTVDDRRTKRMAEECVERISGVSDVQNQIKVGSGGNKWQMTTGGNHPQNGQVSTNTSESDKSDKSKHRA